MALLRQPVAATLLLLLAAAAAADLVLSQMAVPGCQSRCGEVEVPYPFGIGNDSRCFRDDGFQLTCNDTAYNPPKLFRGTYEILGIDLPQGLLRATINVAHNCFDTGGRALNTGITSASLTNSPYTFSSEYDRFYVTGCDTLAYMTDPAVRFATGCVSFCLNISSVKKGSCSGIGCCQTEIPRGVKSFEAQFTSFYNHTYVHSFNPCSYAFLADKEEFIFNTSILAADYTYQRVRVPTVLEFSVENQTCEEARDASFYACRSSNSDCLASKNGLGYICNCSLGYSGNPYLDGGCRDIDECRDKEKYPCGGICTNIPGGYNCTCPEGSYRDARKGTCSDAPNFSRRGNSLLGVLTIGMADQTPSPELLALLAHWAATGHPIPRELAHYLPLVHGAPSRPSVSQGGGSSSRQRRSTPPPPPPPPENPPSVPADAPASDRYMCFIDDNFTFAHQSALAGEITRIFKAFAQLAEYRWTYMSPAEQEWIFDGVLRSFPPAPGCTKEFFRPAFVKLAERRISDAVYRARTAALKKLARPDPTAAYTAADYLAIKAFPPTWCLPARWERWCDIWATDAQFLRRSTAGRTNRDKQGIRSTSGSKSHAQLRRELETKLGRPPTTQEWWKATHTRGDNEWSTEEGKQVYDRYEELYQEKYRDVPAAEHPADDKTLWRQVMRGRAVGESRKQALGGLPPSFDRESSSSSHYSRPTPTYPQSQPPSQESQSLQQTMTSVVQSLHTITTLLTENIRHAAPANRPRGNHPQVEESDSEDVELNLSSDSDAEYEEEEVIRERREAHERWQESRASRKGKEPAPSKKKSSVTQKDMMAGGTDTTSTTVEWALAELARKPTIMARLAEELDAVVGRNSVLEEPHLPELHYLDAVVKETLRLDPIFPISVPRNASADCELGGYAIPRDTGVFINVWAIQRDPSIWEQPHEFWPERFLEHEDRWGYKRMGGAFMPFGGGRRICAGLNLAERMVKYMVGSLVHSFDWKLPPAEETIDMASEPGFMLKKKKPLVLVPYLKN